MRIAVLVSGGVDSSVALRLLKEQGHEVTAFYLKIWLEDELAHLGDCPWQEDLAYVRAVCEQAEVPLEVVSLQKEYFDHVVRYAINEVQAGRTPNPDVFCNVMIKFGFFIDHIEKKYPSMFEKIASGHYAQIVHKHGKYLLKKAPDAIKDQTYFLSYLTQSQLAKVLFPIGGYTKAQVRDLAQRYDLANKDRKDSQGICFLGKLKFNDFLSHYLGKKEGEKIEYETGEVLGKHQGFWFYTIGQRRGSGLSGGPWYVVAKDPKTNRVYFSRTYYEHKDRKSLRVSHIRWHDSESEIGRCAIKLRHGPHEHMGEVERLDSKNVHIMLHEDDQGIAPGQIAAFYQGDLCIGAGIIAD